MPYNYSLKRMPTMKDEYINKLNPFLLSASFVNKDNIDPGLVKHPERIVKWYEFELVVWGSGFINTNGEKIPAIENTVFFRYPGMKVQGYLPYSSYFFILDLFHDENKIRKYTTGNLTSAGKETFNRNFLNNLFTFDKNSYLTDNNSPVINIFKDIYRLFIAGSNEDRLKVKILLLQMISQIEKEITENFLNTQTARKVSYFKELEKVKKQIDNNPAKNFTLNELSFTANLSPNFLCRLFSDRYKISLFKYINKCRVNMAKSLLSETSESVSKISRKCGFENESYFYRVFKRHTGLTPVQYRSQSVILDWE